MKLKFAILLSLVVMSFSLAACNNTVNGVGRDWENWGKEMQGKN